MNVQEEFKCMARRLLFVQRRLYRLKIQQEEFKNLAKDLEIFVDKINRYYGPRIASEITWKEGEK